MFFGEMSWSRYFIQSTHILEIIFFLVPAYCIPFGASAELPDLRRYVISYLGVDTYTILYIVYL